MTARLPALVIVVVGLTSLGFLLRASRPPHVAYELQAPSNTQSGFFQDIHWDARAIACIVVTFTVSALANAAGVGGGGFLVPLFNLVLGLSLKKAMALTQAAITGGAVAGGALALFESHPLDETQPLLDLDAALVILPCLLLGVTLGVTFNQVFPNWLLVVILTFLLVLLSIKTLRSGLRLYAAERRGAEENEEEGLLIAASSELPALSPKAGRHSFERSLEASRAGTAHAARVPSQPIRPPLLVRLGDTRIPETDEEGSALESHPVQLSNSHPSSLASSPRSDVGSPDGLTELLQASGKKMPGTQQEGDHVEDSTSHSQAHNNRWVPSTAEGSFNYQTPFQEASEAHGAQRRQGRCKSHLRQSIQLLLLILIWAAFLALQLLKDRFLNCSRPYFAIFGGQVALCIVASMTFITVWSCSRQAGQSSLEASLLSPRPAQPQTSPAKLFLTGLIVLLGGSLSALCGLGGGMVLGPAMLELGLHPLVTASTSLLLVGASSSSATIEFSLAHELPHSWALIVFVLCFVASLVGVAVIGRYVRASGRASVIVFLLTFLTFVGGILTAVVGGMRAYESLHHGGQAGFIDLCTV